MKNKIKYLIFNLLGFFSILLGILGAILPLLPTTPFILLASFFFSKGTPKFHRWLISLKYFGPQIKTWEDHGVIGKKSKFLAGLMIFSTILYFILFSQKSIELRIFISTILSLVFIFILTRPSKMI